MYALSFRLAIHVFPYVIQFFRLSVCLFICLLAATYLPVHALQSCKISWKVDFLKNLNCNHKIKAYHKTWRVMCPSQTTRKTTLLVYSAKNWVHYHKGKHQSKNILNLSNFRSQFPLPKPRTHFNFYWPLVFPFSCIFNFSSFLLVPFK